GRRGAVGVDAGAVLVEGDVVGDFLGARRVLGVDAVAVAAVRGDPAVVVDQAAVDLRVDGLLPEGEPLAGVVDDQVDELRAHAAAGRLVDLDRLAAGDVGGPGGDLGGDPVQVRAHHLEAPVPGVGAGDEHNAVAARIAPAERRPLARVLPHEDRIGGGARQP